MREEKARTAETSEEDPRNAVELPEVGCEPYEGMYPLHEEWGTGEIGGREYRVLRSLQGPHVIVEFPQEEYDDYYEEREAYKFHIGDMVQHAFAVNQSEEEE